MTQRHHQLLLSTFALVAAAMSLALRPAHAGDEGVYGAAAPPDSAFIRVFNASATPDLEARIADKEMNDILAYGASDFVFLPPGKYTLTAGTVTQPVTLKATRFYTAVVDSKGLRLLDNDRYANHLKAELIVYNLVDGATLSLKTADGRPVIENVAANASGSREVNAVKAAFTLYDGATKVADVRPEALERGHVFSLFVVGSKDSPVTSWVVN